MVQPLIIYLSPRLLCLCPVCCRNSQEEQQSGRNLDGDEMDAIVGLLAEERGGEVMDYR